MTLLDRLRAHCFGNGIMPHIHAPSYRYHLVLGSFVETTIR
jgi:hypothetical protein